MTSAVSQGYTDGSKRDKSRVGWVSEVPLLRGAFDAQCFVQLAFRVSAAWGLNLFGIEGGWGGVFLCARRRGPCCLRANTSSRYVVVLALLVRVLQFSVAIYHPQARHARQREFHAGLASCLARQLACVARLSLLTGAPASTFA